MPTWVRIVIGVFFLALGLAACGSSPSSAPTTHTTTTTTTTSGPSSSSGTVGLAVESSPKYGKILATTKGITLYALSSDTSTKSTCSAKCASIWPPFTVTAVPTFAAGVKESLAGDVVRPDGSHQLTYGGHPLYTFVGDKAPHETNGEGIVSFGGTWSAVSATTGKPVRKGGSSTTSTTSGGGY